MKQKITVIFLISVLLIANTGCQKKEVHPGDVKGYEEGRVTREEMETAAGHLLCMIRRIHGKEK